VYISSYRSTTATARISNSTIRNCKSLGWGLGGGIYISNCHATISDTTFELCQAANSYGAVYVTSGYNNVITGSKFINCTSGGYDKIFDASLFDFIRDCTFTHDSALPNLAQPFINNSELVVTLFGRGGGNFEACTFNNLRGNMPAGQNYLFDRWATYPPAYGGTGAGTISSGAGNLTLKNCTFNFNSGSAGLFALYGGQTGSTPIAPDYLLMDGNVINDTGGQRPLMWFTNSTGSTAGTFRFRPNNTYNGTLLDTTAAITGLAVNGLIRLDNGAMPVLVP
jgi:hypothetical protein